MAWFSEQIKSQMEERYGDEVKSKIDTRKAGKKKSTTAVAVTKT